MNEEKRTLQLQLIKHNEENTNLSSPPLFQPHRYSPVQLASLTNTLNRTKFRDCGTNTMGILKRDVGCNAVPVRLPTPSSTPSPTSTPTPTPIPVITKRDVGISTDITRVRSIAIQTLPKVNNTVSVGMVTVGPSRTSVGVQTPAAHLQVVRNESINIVEKLVEDKNYQSLSLKSLNETSAVVAPKKTMTTAVSCQTAPVNIVPFKTLRQQYTDTKDLTPVQRQQFTDTRDLIKFGERGTDTKGLIHLQSASTNTQKPPAVSNVGSNTEIVTKSDSSTNTLEEEQRNVRDAHEESETNVLSKYVTSNNKNNPHITIKCTNNNFCDSCKETIRVMAKQFSKLNLVTIQQPIISTIPDDITKKSSPPTTPPDDLTSAFVSNTISTTPTSILESPTSRIPRRRPNGTSSVPTTPQSPKASPKLTRQNTYTVPMTTSTDDTHPVPATTPEEISTTPISLSSLQNRPRTTTPEDCPAEAFLRFVRDLYLRKCFF